MLEARIREISDRRLLAEPSYRKRLLSRVVLASFRQLPETVKKVLFRGDKFFCPVCGNHVSVLLPFASRHNVWCPVCTSFQRHRFAWVFLETKTNLFDGRPKRMLHVGPEPAFARRLSQIEYLDYLSADLDSPRAMVRMNITDIQYPDDTFDVIYCSHVLEHVPEVARALQEFRRVLKPSGWAAFMVPMHNGLTVGDPSVTDPAERVRRFGQHDHFWRFGSDFASILASAGFVVEQLYPRDVAPADQCRLMSIADEAPIFCCHKMAANGAS